MVARRSLLLFLISIYVITSGSGAVLANTPQAEIGVVILHPKSGTPAFVHSWFKKIGKEKLFKTKFQRGCGGGTWVCSADKSVISHRNNTAGLFAIDLYEEGFLIESPLCAWSKRKNYSDPIDAALVKCVVPRIKKLKKRGAKKIVIVGYSLGANAAMRAGVFVNGIDAIVAMAPGHTPEKPRTRDSLGDSIAQARAKISSGNGREKIKFSDFNQGKITPKEASAENFLSWFDPEGKAVLALNAPKIRAGTAFLWIAGKDDIISDGTGRYLYGLVPSHPKSRFILVRGGHKDVRKFGKNQIIDWLKGL